MQQEGSTHRERGAGWAHAGVFDAHHRGARQRRRLALACRHSKTGRVQRLADVVLNWPLGTAGRYDADAGTEHRHACRRTARLHSTAACSSKPGLHHRRHFSEQVNCRVDPVESVLDAGAVKSPPYTYMHSAKAAVNLLLRQSAQRIQCCSEHRGRRNLAAKARCTLACAIVWTPNPEHHTLTPSFKLGSAPGGPAMGPVTEARPSGLP